MKVTDVVVVVIIIIVVVVVVIIIIIIIIIIIKTLDLYKSKSRRRWTRPTEAGKNSLNTVSGTGQRLDHR
jgi:uncharacterized membrane protein YqiK